MSDASTRTGNSVGMLEQAIVDHLFYSLAKFPAVATRYDYFMAVAYAVRDRLLERWVRTASTYLEGKCRTVCYLSAEFLMGPQLANNLLGLGIRDQVEEAVARLGVELDDLIDVEEEPGLGNGGLGRLAACYMDSLATLEIPAIGYGIRYEFGIFDQEIRDGWQVEIADKWLRLGNPWEIARPEITYPVKLGGRTESYTDGNGRYRVRWIPDRVVAGTPYDTPVIGYGVPTTNFLRLWKAEAPESFDFAAFNVGDYYGAVEDQVTSENITKVLYPNDEPESGKALRLEQQYFFVSCTLQDMIRLYSQRMDTLDELHDKFVVQLNDTHPAIGVAELMRLLVDEHDLDWDRAWNITTRTFAYTNHTLLPEALEKWPLPLFARILPRHLEIIYEINRRFLDELRARGVDAERLARMSIIDESGPRWVRMANLACVGSYAVNGVAELHTKLLRRDVLADFCALWPDKLTNKTNGVTPRRFVVTSNPRLAKLVTAEVGEGWVRDLDQLRGLEARADDRGFHDLWRSVKHANKAQLAESIARRTGVTVDPRSMFDVLVKRIHEYKRQHLKVLHIVALYHRIKRDPSVDVVPRTFIFGGKAAPGYFMAKRIIKLITRVGEVVNADPDVRERLKVVFYPDFNVKNAEPVYPAADLSEQISMAGKEASGTGNMKFALNGAITVGTLDGANIEIAEAVGDEGFFVFGLDAGEVSALKQAGYRAEETIAANETLRAVLEDIRDGVFAGGDPGLFAPLVDELTYRDRYMVTADFQSYVDCQDRIDDAFRDSARWTRMSILNTARTGRFSSDRAIAEYCRDIWHVEPVPIDVSVTAVAAPGSWFGKD